ncbi:uncharacterized protein PAC_11199 [Phialocephala subalpina]|uniref:2EXR domain-containing protein n=1 Tax=Phialocephala subalpina TaxID=576137 RepID=A0A1L7X8F2_9HELO|nr:uncharacterized protein PAC_11199 [Phialocephala subalpina]
MWSVPGTGTQSRGASSTRARELTLEKKLLSLEQCPDLSLFRTLPLELSTRIWEMTAEEERIVAVHAATDDGLRAKVPPMLHVCAESRAVGLKFYSLAFGHEGSSLNIGTCDVSENDSLIWRTWKTWRGSGLIYVRVSVVLARRLNIDIFLAPWKGLKTLYLGLKGGDLASNGEVAFKELGAELQEEFLQKYKGSPVHRAISEDLSVNGALDFIKTSSGRLYSTHSGSAGHMVLAEDFCEKTFTHLRLSVFYSVIRHGKNKVIGKGDYHVEVHYPACFERRNDGSNFLPSGQIRLSRHQRASQPQAPRPSKGVEQINPLEAYFDKIPFELRNSIWELASTIEGRVVSVHTVTDGGLRAQVPPLLHVCRESRAVAMKHYTLSFGGLSYGYLSKVPKSDNWEDLRFQIVNKLPPRVYFNFDRDILYFRGNWNKDVEGEWGCFSQFPRLIDKADLDRVQKLGFQLNARMCSGGADPGHGLQLRGWTQGPKDLYFGLEDAGLGSSHFIKFTELEYRRQRAFLEEYGHNTVWAPVPDGDDYLEKSEESITKAFRFIKQESGIIYARRAGPVTVATNRNQAPQPGICENVFPVLAARVEAV